MMKIVHQDQARLGWAGAVAVLRLSWQEGCEIKQHWPNMMTEERACYQLQGQTSVIAYMVAGVHSHHAVCLWMCISEQHRLMWWIALRLTIDHYMCRSTFWLQEKAIHCRCRTREIQEQQGGMPVEGMDPHLQLPPTCFQKSRNSSSSSAPAS